MIRIIHSPESSGTPFGSLKAEMENSIEMKEFNEPVRFVISSTVSGKIQWESLLTPGCWSYYGMISNTRSQIIRKNEILCEFIWDTFLHGDLAHQCMMLWSMENKGSFGIAIGTHNGETGEWVEPMRRGIVEGILVEASEIQFLELMENYKDLKNCYFLNSLITEEGGKFTFWESEDASYTNSVLKDHVERHSENLKSKIMDSISLNSLISSQEKKVKWLHLDVEGIDTDLILSISPENIKDIDFIIYETLNTLGTEKEKCSKFLEENGFKVKESGWNTIAIRN
jgi:FkbM family methyltransferase